MTKWYPLTTAYCMDCEEFADKNGVHICKTYKPKKKKNNEIQKEIEELEKRTSDLFNPTMMTDIDRLYKLRKKIKKGNK